VKMVLSAFSASKPESKMKTGFVTVL